MRKSFTLIELIVVIGIIALLSALGVSSYNGFQQNARDTRRKNDLKTITNALNAYYSVHGRFPAPDPDDRFPTQTGKFWGSSKCDYNTHLISGGTIANCYTSSTYGDNWIPKLVEEGFIESLPVDPINNSKWPWDEGNYSYSYGNLYPDGQGYDLTTQLENSADPDRCGQKKYKFIHGTDWCGSYSDQIYELSPDTH